MSTQSSGKGIYLQDVSTTGRLQLSCATAGDPEAAAPSEPGGWEGAPPPPPAEPLPQLSALARAPSPLLRWQLPQLLFAYCNALRLFNGDYRADPLVRSGLQIMFYKHDLGLQVLDIP